MMRASTARVSLAVILMMSLPGAALGQLPAGGKAIDEGAALAAIRDDLGKAAPETRKFLRYFTLMNLDDAGRGEDPREAYRLALSKLVNSLSWHRRIRAPQAIDPARAVLRIDLRHYLWEARTWDAIVRGYPYALRSDDDAARAVAEMSGCAVAHVRADWFLAAASRPPLYYEVLRLPATIGELETRLDVDAQQDLRTNHAARAGFSASGFTRGKRLIERHETSYGAYWRTFDFLGDAGRRDLLARPLGPGEGELEFEHDGGEVLFDLPNGLQATMIVDAGGRRLDAKPADALREGVEAGRAMVAGVSCMGCHSRGVIEKADEVREKVAGTKSLTDEVAAALMGLYPPRDWMGEMMRRDSGRYTRAVKDTGVAPDQADPVQTLARRFDDEKLDLKRAAREAGLTVAELKALAGKAPQLSAAVKPLLSGGVLKRKAFEEVFPRIAEARRPAARPPAAAGRTDVAMPKKPVIDANSKNWVVLLRGRDPKAWNTRGSDTTFAVPLSEAPADMKFLRLRRLDTGEGLILPLTHDRLAKSIGNRDDPTAVARWCGTGDSQFGGAHLGIAEGPMISGGDASGRGKIAIQMDSFNFFTGSGFGHQAHGDGRTQHFGWRGEVIPPTDFEIAVARGPLSDAEKAALVGSAPPDAK